MRENTKVRAILISLISIVFIQGFTAFALFLALEDVQREAMKAFLIFIMCISIILFALLHLFFHMLTMKNGIIERLDNALMKSLQDNENLEEKKGDLEIQLRHTQKLESIGTLAAGMAHDFNNLLSPILGYSDLALSRLSRDETLYLYINEIVRAAAKAKEQVEQILDYSRETARVSRESDLSTIIEETITVIRPLIPSTVEIILDLDEEQLYVKTDPASVNQILVNLCTNGWQAMEEQGGQLIIKTKAEGDFIVLSIRDTGTGIDSETKTHMFEPFYSTRTDKSSSGLGLSVVQGIVSSCRGKIAVDSTPGLGSSFSIYLPGKSKEAPFNNCRNIMDEGGHILLVDDDSNITNLICSMLSGLGFTIDQFNDSPTALDAFRDNPDEYNLVITDLTMPGMTGSELKKELIKIRSEIPVLIMTGYGKNQPAETKSILKKPFVKKELLAAIEQILG